MKKKKDGFREFPVERSHGEIVILSLPDGELLGKIIEEIESVAGIELFIVFSVAAFHLAIMPQCKGANLLVPDAELRQCLLKERQRLFLAVSHFIYELEAVVRLNALDDIGDLLYHMLQEPSGRIGTLLLEGLQVAETIVFIYEGVLIIFFPRLLLQPGRHSEHISHLSVLFALDTASSHKVLQYIWGLTT